jgi:methylmalonyl-CoA mutase
MAHPKTAKATDLPKSNIYQPKHAVRIVTAASLFDGHDVAINIMRRIMQSTGAEVIHLGHNRSAEEIVRCAIQEDAQAIAITSYQGGHIEYFKYIHDLLQQKGARHIKIFGGGGGTILPEEIQYLQENGIDGIFSPDDGRKLGLQGMINAVVKQSDFDLTRLHLPEAETLTVESHSDIARLITLAENSPERFAKLFSARSHASSQVPVLGITGTGGSGKSSLTDEIIRRFLRDFPDLNMALLSIDPTRKRSGGALLGDRIRMNAIDTPRVYMRSMATRQSNLSLSSHVGEALGIFKAAGFGIIFLETSGIGQSGVEITDHADLSLYVMTPEYGAATQLEKIDMLDFADLVAINKFDKQGAEDALREVRKQFVRNRQLWEADADDLPVIGTTASQFNDPGTNALYEALLQQLNKKDDRWQRASSKHPKPGTEKQPMIPPKRQRYLSEIAEVVRTYNREADEKSKLAGQIDVLRRCEELLESQEENVAQTLLTKRRQLEQVLGDEWLEMLQRWPEMQQRYAQDKYAYSVRGREVKVDMYSPTLSHLKIPKVILPRYTDWQSLLRWLMQENVPGSFPFTAGVYPLKRESEDPTRMFAGEGNPERTNRRFHYLSQDQQYVRLSTAFDSVTLYGEDPHERPDILGKVGNSGVSICSLEDAKRLYSGFDLCEKNTSVSMTINGPAATICAFFMNAAIDQQCEKYIRAEGLHDQVEVQLQKKYDERGIERPTYRASLPTRHDRLGLLLLGITGDEVLERDVYEKIKSDTLRQVRGTVQADILKEDQAQNTCIFSTEFSLRLMGDMQQYFIDHQIRNFYSVSISGYHIAEAGANPITQLALTLANGFTYVEYYLNRGMYIDAFAPNLSFFFSNGVDAEYAVIGRVARRIWAKAMKLLYQGNERAQKLKYHIQTSGRSLHAQEISFNDIRTTLQALYAIYDNCNSLHTNAYDEAITTPTEESVRRAMAIQLIINKELGLAKNENPMQGSFLIEELTDLVEEAVLAEFDRLTDRGGVLGAMERMYQRSKIQEESLYYESKKHNGDLPIVGVNTFLSKNGSPTVLPGEVIRATDDEKKLQITSLTNLHQCHARSSARWLNELKQAAAAGENTFATLMETVKYCSLGQITHALFEVGGQYRRNM